MTTETGELPTEATIGETVTIGYKGADGYSITDAATIEGVDPEDIITNYENWGGEWQISFVMPENEVTITFSVGENGTLSYEPNDHVTSVEFRDSSWSGNVITSVSQDSDGKFVVTYKDDSDQEYSVVLATMDEMLDVPVLGVALDEEERVYYWTQTVDGETSWLLKGENGERIPVRGNTPALSVDDEGYWTVNGERLVDAAGNPIGAEDGSSSIFREASYEEGIFSLTLGNGEKLTIPVFNTLNLKLSAPALVTIIEPSAGYRIGYELSGEAQA